MKNNKKLQSRLFILAGILLFISALVSILAGNKNTTISFVPLGFCFIALGVANSRKNGNDNE